jgi:hypothetical protein
MGIDNETSLKNVAVVIDKNKEMLKQLEDNSINIRGEEEHKKKPQFWFSEDIGKLNTEEYYFEEEECALHYSGISETAQGTVYCSFDLPLSDVVLIDILQHSIKRLNKLKTALETLK